MNETLKGLIANRPKVITDLLAADDTGTVANYIRKLEAALAAQDGATQELPSIRDNIRSAQEGLAEWGERYREAQDEASEEAVKRYATEPFVKENARRP